MTQQEKELLLQDLCMRLPYRPKVKIGEHSDYAVVGIDLSQRQPVIIEMEKYGQRIEGSFENIKPILRSLGTMTLEERKEYDSTCSDWYESLETYQWLCKNHFDFNYLIPMGLAVEITNK